MQAPKTTAYYKSPIEVGLLWAKITYIQSHSKALGFGPKLIWNRSFKWGTKNWFWSRGCKDIRGQSWRSKNICLLARFETNAPGAGRFGRYFFCPPTLTSDIFAVPWPKSIFSTSFERSISYLFGDQSPRLLNDF